MPGRLSRGLPDFPWDTIAGARELAGAHPDGMVDLSVGAPVDPTPEVVRLALCRAADAPGYPSTHGTGELREAAVEWMFRRLGVGPLDPADVLPTIGTKELVAWLPTLLGLGPADTVVVPEIAYPTYDVGARLAGAQTLARDGLFGAGPARVRLVWVNSPANPTGRVLPVEHLRKVVAWARHRGAVVASDECYIELGWDPDAQPVSLLHPSVCDGDPSGLLVVHSASKRSNLAGYRAGFLAGDPVLVRALLQVRKHAGMMVPTPVQVALTAALRDDDHVAVQRAVYGARRTTLKSALTGAGLRVDESKAGLYLWVSRDEPADETLAWFARRGILVAPGHFYGAGGARHVRVALTASDERVAAAAVRLGTCPTGADG